MNTLTMKLRNRKMDAISTKLTAAGILFLLTLISGVVVSHSGRPLSIGLVTVHKLIAVGMIVLLGLALNQMYQTGEEKSFLELGSIILSGIFFLALIATGALLTREEIQLPEFVLKIHQAAPLLGLVSSTLSLYLLARGK